MWSEMTVSSLLFGFIIGILVSLIAAYIKPPIDKWLGSVFQWYNIKNIKQREATEQLIQKLKNDSTEYISFAISLNNQLSIGLIYIIIALISVLIPHFTFPDNGEPLIIRIIDGLLVLTFSIASMSKIYSYYYHKEILNRTRLVLSNEKS